MTTPSSLDIATRRAEYANVAGNWARVRSVLRIITEDEALNRMSSQFVLSRDIEVDADQHQRLSDALMPKLMNHTDFSMQSERDLRMLIEFTYDELLGVSSLGPFWRDDTITEILVDAWDSITIEQRGTLIRTPVSFKDLTHAQDVARRLALKVSDRALNPANPLVTAELPGARVAFAIDRVVKSGISISMRKFPELLGMEELRSFGALSEDMEAFLKACVIARANIVVSGGTGTGKTTFINALSEFIPDSERVITIEDAYELTLRNTHWVALQTKEAASSDDQVHVDLVALLRNTLRMRPDRIIVGEIREAAGAAVMLQAANTGHDGTMTTVHANSADRALNFRLTGLVRTAQAMPAEVAASEVASAIDVVVQVSRERGRRFVSAVVVADPSMLSGATITSEVVFTGHLNAENEPEFSDASPLPTESALAQKLFEAGVEAHWIQKEEGH